MIPAGPEFHKPKSIVAAKNILYAAIFIGCLAVIVRYSILGLVNNGGIIAITLIVFGFLAIILLVKAMNRCKKWARTVLLVWYCVMIFTIVVYANLITGILEGVLWGIQFLLQVVAFFFLFNKESNVWFNKRQQ